MAGRMSADAACAFDGMLPATDSAAFLTHFDFSAIDEMDPSLGKSTPLSPSSPRCQIAAVGSQFRIFPSGSRREICLVSAHQPPHATVLQSLLTPN